MARNHVFDRSDWIALGKKWSEVPPHIKRGVKDYFVVPPEHADSIFPTKTMPVRQMMDFAVPSPVQSVAADAISPASYFSRTTPAPISEALLLRLRRLPIPPPRTIKKLLEVGQQAVLDGFESVQYNHLAGTVTTYFPLWVVSYWFDVYTHQTTVRNSWGVSLKWVQCEIKQKISQERRELAQDVAAMLHALPWGLIKTGASLGDEPIHAMSKYLGSNWTTGTMQNDMLHSLATHIAADPLLDRRFVVQTSALSQKIIEAYDARTSNNYHQAPTFKWIRRCAEDIILNRRTLLTFQHLGKEYPHWVSIVIDGENRKILYGDSFHDTIPIDLLSAYQWWLSQHTTSVCFNLEDLAIGTQTDSSSCGFYAENALEHHALPNSIPLITAAGAKSERMKQFLSLSQKILESPVSFLSGI